MKRAFLPIMALCWVGLCQMTSLQGQNHVLLRDEFNQLQHIWDIRQGETSLGEGRMNWRQYEAGERIFWGMEQYLDTREKFILSATFFPVAARGNASYGIFWGANEELTNYYAFEVNQNGYARVIQCKAGEISVLQNWQRNRKIKGLDNEHTIAMRKDGRGAYFSVNDRDLFRLEFPNLNGFFHGFTLNGACEIAADAFMIQHPVINFPRLGSTWPDAVKLHLDTTINMPYENETHPHFHPTRMQFLFSRDENIYETHVSDSGWTAGHPLNFNNEDANHVVGFGKDARNMILGSRYGQDGVALGTGLSIASSTGREWENWALPNNIQVPPLPPQQEAVDWYLSEDEKILLFAAVLPGGYGDQDIYVCFKNGNGWTKPLNLGPSVNSFGKEYSPWLDEDTETLFLGSNGRPGYGRGDLYQIKRLSRTWTKWGLLYNLGGGINTDQWDRDFYPHPRENQTYFVASKDSGRKDYDLYRVKIPIDLDEEELAKVYGTVYLHGTDQPLEAEVQAWKIGGSGFDKDGEARTTYGSYGMLLPLKSAYQMYAVKVGYYPVLDTLDIRPFSSYREIKMDLYLKKLEVGMSITLEQVFFERSKAEFLPESYAELNRLVLLMQSMPNLRIDIRGHTDNIGDPNVLQRLSEARAERVRQYLLNRNIPAYRMSSQGFGASQPIAPNENPITRALNRRVEFVILGN